MREIYYQDAGHPVPLLRNQAKHRILPKHISRRIWSIKIPSRSKTLLYRVWRHPLREGRAAFCIKTLRRGAVRRGRRKETPQRNPFFRTFASLFVSFYSCFKVYFLTPSVSDSDTLARLFHVGDVSRRFCLRIFQNRISWVSVISFCFHQQQFFMSPICLRMMPATDFWTVKGYDVRFFYRFSSFLKKIAVALSQTRLMRTILTLIPLPYPLSLSFFSFRCGFNF